VKECVNKAFLQRSRKVAAGDDEDKGPADEEETDAFPSLPNPNAVHSREAGPPAAPSDACREALASDGGEFLHTATEVLQLTMYNLLQEAAYGEFAVAAEPLAFMIKTRDNSGATTQL
jgi:hypothetical protein